MMKKINLPRSFAARVGIYFLLATGAVFAVAFLVFYYSARTLSREDAKHQAEAALSNMVLRIDEVLKSVEVAVSNSSWMVEEYRDEPEKMYDVVRRLLITNPEISGSAVAFEPAYFPEHGDFYSPYAYRAGDTILTKQLGSEDYDYHYMDWYQIPKLLENPYWSEPYFDTGGGEMLMSTYSLPMYDRNGKLYAVFTADISLEWLTEMVNSIQLYPHSYNMVIGRSATYLVHFFPERILNETIFTGTDDMLDRRVEAVGQAMISGQKGFATISNDSLSTSYVFYAPIERCGWSVAVVCTYKDIFAGVDRIRFTVLLVSIVGMCLLLLFCIYIVRGQTRPLTRLADATLQIARGDFSASLPAIRKKATEISKLYDSFVDMQHSLVAYVEELKKTTTAKERIESELRIANEIQMGMVPKIFPPFPKLKSIDLYAKLKPAREVGGDLYDFFLVDKKLYFTIGDVSGKGVPASLLMVVTCNLFRTVAQHLEHPSAIVSMLNDSIAKSNDSGMFVTLFLGVLDLTTGRLCFCNAGHNAPVMLESGKAPSLMKVNPNIPLGVMSGFDYQSQEIQLAEQTTLFMYTDGVTEAENTSKELFSESRMLQALSTRDDLSPVEMVNRVMEQIMRYTRGAEQSDDITLLCVRYLTREQE